jgi:hypothetical protein
MAVTLRLVSDGTPAGTKVYDESGAQVTNVRGFSFDLHMDKPTAKVLLEVTDVHAEFTFDLANTWVSGGGAVAWRVGPDGYFVLCPLTSEAP